jgi:nuclear transport factor 2 (NTF2) superfamily protein
MIVRPPLPPFNLESAAQKVRAAENAWNTRDPASVALAHTPNSRWRYGSEFFSGRKAIQEFLTRKWQTQLEYRQIKELWSFSDNRIAVRFVYESHDADGRWWRSHGNENWHFDADGLMAARHTSTNDVPITEDQRLFRWPLGIRPEGYPGLTELGL